MRGGLGATRVGDRPLLAAGSKGHEIEDGAASRARKGPSERGVELPIVNMSVGNGGESSERGLSFLLKRPPALANVPARGPLERPPGRVRLGWWPLAAGFLAGSYAGVRSLESSGAGAGVRGRGGKGARGGGSGVVFPTT